MAKLSLLFSLGLMICVLDKAYSMGTYYYYPENSAAMTYPYQPYGSYMYAPYAIAAAPDCEKKEEGSSESSSSSSESSSSESSEEKEEKKEEGEEEEGGSEEEEKKEEGEESSSSSSSEESKEEKEEKKEKKEKKKEEKEEKPLFPPVAYAFPPRPAQVVYSAPVSSYPYAGYKAYSMVPQSVAYRTSYPYYNYAAAPVARVVSSPVSKIMSPAAYAVPSGKSMGYGVGAPSAYWAPAANVGYYKAK